MAGSRRSGGGSQRPLADFRRESTDDTAAVLRGIHASERSIPHWYQVPQPISQGSPQGPPALGIIQITNVPEVTEVEGNILWVLRDKDHFPAQSVGNARLIEHVWISAGAVTDHHLGPINQRDNVLWRWRSPASSSGGCCRDGRRRSRGSSARKRRPAVPDRESRHKPWRCRG